jgi:apolipoprotein N-acyltransferase
MLSKIASRHFFIASTSALVLALAYDFPRYGWPVMFIGLIPFLFLLENHLLSKKKTFLIGYLFGAIYLGGTTLWLLQSFPLDWARISSPFTSSLLVIATWLIIAITLGVFVGLWALAFRKLRSGKPIADALLAASLWILFEYFRTFASSIIWTGPESTIGAHWVPVLGHSSPGRLPFLTSVGEHTLSFIIISNARFSPQEHWRFSSYRHSGVSFRITSSVLDTHHPLRGLPLLSVSLPKK